MWHAIDLTNNGAICSFFYSLLADVVVVVAVVCVVVVVAAGKFKFSIWLYYPFALHTVAYADLKCCAIFMVSY